MKSSKASRLVDDDDYATACHWNIFSRFIFIPRDSREAREWTIHVTDDFSYLPSLEIKSWKSFCLCDVVGKGSRTGKVFSTATPCSQMKIHGGEERNVHPKRLDRKREREWVRRKLCVFGWRTRKAWRNGFSFHFIADFFVPDIRDCVCGKLHVQAVAKKHNLKVAKINERSRLVELGEKFRESDCAFPIWIIILQM